MARISTTSLGRWALLTTLGVLFAPAQVLALGSGITTGNGDFASLGTCQGSGCHATGAPFSGTSVSVSGPDTAVLGRGAVSFSVNMLSTGNAKGGFNLRQSAGTGQFTGSQPGGVRCGDSTSTFDFVCDGSGPDRELTHLSDGKAPTGGSTAWPFTWEPSSVGTATFRVCAMPTNDSSTTGDGPAVCINRTVAVSNAAAPVFTSTPVTTARVGVQYSYSLTATDANGDSVTFSLTSGPTGMSLSGSTLSWTPSAGQAGSDNDVVLSVTDNLDGSTSQSFSVHVNAPPTANAGPDQPNVLEGATVNLSGQGMDTDGTIAGFAWTQVADGAPMVSLSGANTATPSFTAPNVSTSQVLTYTLNITDNSGDSATDTVAITVNNDVPTANAGMDQTVAGGDLVTLNGAASAGNGLAFAWSVVSGGVSLTGGTTAAPSFTAPVVGTSPATVVLQLVVTDSDGDSSSPDQVTVFIDALPVANAAASPTTVDEGGAVTLDSSLSTDAEGVVTAQWTQTAGTSVGFLTGANPSFTAPAVAPGGDVLTFQLTVTDSRNQTDTANVSVTVNDVNVLPTANAGPDQSVAEGASVTLEGGASVDNDTDGFGGILLYTWTQVANGAPTVSLSGANGASATNPTFTAPQVPIAGATLVFSLVVVDTADMPSTASTVTITVNDVNDTPVASAGGNQTVAEGTNVTLDGSGSTDADLPEDSLSYSWTQTANGATTVTLSDASAVSPSFTAPAVAAAGESLVFSLVVTDLANASSSASSVTITVTDNNAAPVASAGVDQNVVEGATVTLNGSASSDVDLPLDSLSYLWAQASGATNVTLSDATAVSPTFVAPSVATGGEAYSFSLTVTDAAGAFSSDAVTINIGGSPPVADAGMNQTVNEAATVTLDASGSSDDSNMLTFLWQETSSAGVVLTGDTTVNPTFTAPNVDLNGQVLTFEVTATNPDNLAATAQVMVTVNNVNVPPTADAGGDQTVDEGSAVSLDASASTVGDPDGLDSLAYSWTQTSGTEVTLSDATSSTPGFMAPVVPNLGASLVFQVTVTDESGATASASTTVTVSNVNQVPVANAGADQSIGEDMLVILDGSNSQDPDAESMPALTFSWVQTSGVMVSLTNADTVQPSFQSPMVGVEGTPLTFALTVTDVFNAQASDNVIVNVTNINAAPVANAGPDQDVAEGATVTLDGSNSSDPDEPGAGSAGLSFSWAQTSGPMASLSDSTAAQPTFLTPEVPESGAAVVFELTVSDSAGLMATDSVLINISNVNRAPSADAGPDQTVAEAVTVTLDGSNSMDSDGSIASYAWTVTMGSVTLSDPSAVQPTFTAPAVVGAATQLQFQLEVTDNGNLMATDSVIVNVTDSNLPPVTNAGADQNVTAGDLVTLDGSASSDPENQSISFLWTQAGGTSVTLSDPASAMPSFTAAAPAAGSSESLTFQLQVTDADGLAGTDTVTVNVQELVIPLPPVANAGADQTAVEATTVILDASASTDPDNSIVLRSWAQVSGPAVTLSAPDQAVTTFIAPRVDASGTSLVFEFTAVDETDLSNTDAVTVSITDNGEPLFANANAVVTASTGAKVGVTTTGGNLVAVAPVVQTSIADSSNRPASFTGDLYDFQVRVATAGATATVVFDLDAPAPADAVWVKYLPNQGGWTDFSANASFNADRTQVTLTLVDGGAGDDDGTANGVIVDPSGLGTFAAAAPPPDNSVPVAPEPERRRSGGCAMGNPGPTDPLLWLLVVLALCHILRQHQRSSCPDNS